jgi:hypothetical protein
MIAAASTRILPSFFTASGEYSTPQTIGEQMAKMQEVERIHSDAIVCTLSGAPSEMGCRISACPDNKRESYTATAAIKRPTIFCVVNVLQRM